MYDPDFQGPVAKRSCTDVLCCIFFMLFVIGYVLLGLTAWAHGDPRRVAYPTDSEGQFCGQKGTPNENKTILFYFNLLRCSNPSIMLTLQCPTTQICVSRCPERFLTYVDMQFLNKEDGRYWEYYRQFCKATARPEESLSDLLSYGDCPSAVYPSRPLLQRCLPDFSTVNGSLTIGQRTDFQDGTGSSLTVIDLSKVASEISKILDARVIGLKVFEDYVTTWKWILLGLTIAMALSWIFLILLRFTAGFIFWVFMFGVLGIIGYGIWYCFLEYNNLKWKPQSTIMLYELGIQTSISLFFHWKQTWFSMMIILSVIEAIIIIVVIFLRRRIHLAIILLKEGSKAIGYIPSTLVYPFLTFILLSICISYWAVTAVFLATSGVPTYKVMAPGGSVCMKMRLVTQRFSLERTFPKCALGHHVTAFYDKGNTYNDYIMTFQIYNFFAFLWLINFVIALGQCALAGAFASYYWAMRKPEDIPKYPLFTAFGRAVRYHTGSLAFGSLILASVQMFKVISQYLDRRLQKAQNSVAKFLRHCLQCCFWCWEKMVKFLNRNAYIMIALYGKNFCASTRDAFSLLMRNILKVAVTDEIIHFVLLLGKVLVSGIVGILAFLLFTERLQQIVEGPTTLNYYWVPFLTVLLGSYLVAHAFFSVYSMCVETIFICFCEDLERNDGSAEKPYFVTPSLHRILTKSVRSPRDRQSRKAPSRNFVK